jgi:hypothetical protein
MLWKKRKMKKYHSLQLLILVLFAVTLWTSEPVFAVPSYIQGVPDWDQPAIALASVLPTGPWGAWCVPTATANIVGYYDDKGVAGIGDSQVFPLTPLWPDPLWQDETADATGGPRADLGWYLNTNDLGLDGNSISPKHRGTKLQHIMDGAAGNGGLGSPTGYFATASLSYFVVRNYGADRMAPAVYTAFDTTGGAQVSHTYTAGFSEIMLAVDAHQPLLAHFDHFNLQTRTRASDANLGGDYDYTMWAAPPEFDPCGYTDDPTGEVWDPCEGLGHTVTVVGYWLGTDGNNPIALDAIIVYDNADGSLPGPAPLPLVLPWTGSPWMGLTLIDPGIMPPIVAVPNGGEAWVADSNYSITWLDAQTVADVVVEYSTNKGSSWVSVSPANVGNTGSYDWVVPPVDSNECLVRVSSAVHSSLFDTSDNPFTIYQCTLYYDLTGDCFINLLDLDALGSEWLECGNPFDANCVP